MLTLPEISVLVMIVGRGVLIVWLAMLLAPVDLPAAESRPRSIVFHDQSDPRAPFHDQAFPALRGGISADPQSQLATH
jgi:hypothetical protein